MKHRKFRSLSLHDSTLKSQRVKEDKKVFISKTRRRLIAMKSSERGRARCECCKVTFCADYVREVKVSNFCYQFLCKDCIESEL